MATTLRVGILGAGRAAQCHAAAYSRLPDVQVTGLWNRTRSRADKLAATLGGPNVRIYENWRDLIQSDEVDVVSIATAPMVRGEPFAEALACGRHVLIEKPIAVHLPEAREMVEAAQKARTATAISFNWRYSPGCQTLWRALQEGQIGKLLDLRFEWRLRANSSMTSWADVGGALREAGSHEFDRIRFLTGWRFQRVVSHVSPPDWKAPSENETVPADTSAFVLAELSDHGLGFFRINLTLGEPERRVIICGEEGTLTLSSDWVTIGGNDEKKTMTLANEVNVFRQNTDDTSPVRLEVASADRQPSNVPSSGQHSWNRLIADFITAVRHEDLFHESVPQLPHISDGLVAKEVIAACELSHTERRWIDLNPTSQRH